ncbi:hypothetical protein [Pectobacterium cacticida]
MAQYSGRAGFAKAYHIITLVLIVLGIVCCSARSVANAKSSTVEKSG